MNRRSNVALCASLVAVSTSLLLMVFSDFAAGEAAQTQDEPTFRGALLSAEQASAERLGELKEDEFNAVVLPLRGGDQRGAEQAACGRVREAGLKLYYWVEVAHCPELADEHPNWMASLQGHPEWRRLFENPPTPKDGEVVKTYPWVPILSREPFDGQLRRVGRLLADRPAADGIFLNDLQGAPSACGCGNHLCRWTTDYGKRRTTTPLTNDAPSQFVAEIEKLLPKSEIIPVWTTECEEHDGAADGLCAGVGCFKGICWKAWTEQLIPVARQSKRIGALVPYRAFERDLPVYGKPAGWIAEAMKTFRTMPGRYEQPGVPASRLLAVVQGWDVSNAQIEQQISVASAAGAGGHLVAFSQIEQSWKPRLHRLRR